MFDPPRAGAGVRAAAARTAARSTLSRYRGKVVLLAFGFTLLRRGVPDHAGDAGAGAQASWAPQAGEVQVVYVTVDPERDDAARMKKYLGRLRSDASSAAPARAAQLDAVRKDYGIAAEEDGRRRRQLRHRPLVVHLPDRSRGRLRALMPYGHAADDFVHDLKILLRSERA